MVASADRPVLRLFKRRLAKTFYSREKDELAGSVWEVSNPSGMALRKKMKLRINVPAAYSGRKNTLARFDIDALKWIFPADSTPSTKDNEGRESVTLELDTLDGHWWGILSESKPLNAASLEISPNPFSPRVLAALDGNTQYGTRIRFRPESDESAEITISLEIHSLEGERIRLIADHKTHPKTLVDYYWDGKTDEGRWARNGRYLLLVTLTPTGGGRTRYLIKPVVLFK
jgi:hypothetical protein